MLRLLGMLWAPPESRAAATHPAVQYGGFTLPLAYGRGILELKYGPLPERDPLTTVVGAPVALPPLQGGPPLVCIQACTAKDF